MAMRLTGLMSGMDTDSMIQELVAGRKKKVDTVKKDQIRLNWQQDAWKDLNKKLKGLQTKYLNSMRFSASYSKKATNVSNSSAVSVLTGETAVNGVQSLEIAKLAKTGYLTGGEIQKKGGGDLNALSKMSDIEGFTDGGTINIKSGRKSVDINITADTTISDVLTEMKKAGVNASFDEKNQRFFISATKSGAASDFSITAADANGGVALSALGLQTDLKDDIASWNEYKKYADYYVAGDRDKTLANMQTMIDATVDTKTATYLKEYKTAIASRESTQKKIDELKEKYASQGKELQSVEVYDKSIEEKNQEIKDLKDSMDGMTPEEKEEALKTLETMEKDLEALKSERADASALASQTATLEKLDNQIADIESYVDITKTEEADGTITYSAAATDKLKGEVGDQYYAKAENASQIIKDYENGTLTSSAVKISGQDAEIYLNGAKFENSNNVFEINGLTITALSETKPGETITLTTQQDTDGIYDMIKGFLKEYNSIINEMDKLYNADSSKGYDPLTSEEKYEMSDKEVEEWEKKIKDSILRRDENLSEVSSALREIMVAGTEVNGKKMYLSDFGIATLGYFNAPDGEKHAYHIDGDADDENTASNADKLKTMISNDPDTVIAFFSQLSKDMYARMDKMSAAVKDQRTYGSFFDDKRMKAEHDEYTKKIADLEKKLKDYEDKWYAKFGAMETAMAKMQSNANALTGLLGGQ